jgi:hypothetical protein
MNEMQQRELRAELAIRLEGPAVSEHRIALQDLVLFGQELQTAVNRVARVLLGQSASAQSGRTPAEIEESCRLEVVALRSGSVELVLDLPQNRQLSFTEDLGEEALKALVGGISGVAGEQQGLPRGFDRGVLTALRESGRLFERGITGISFNLHAGEGHWTAEYTPQVRDRIVSRIQRPTENSRTVEGRLLMGDFKETNLRCRLHPPLGKPILCAFDEAQKEDVLAALTRFVRVVGEATEREGEIQSLRIQYIEVLDPVGLAHNMAARSAADFFSTAPDIDTLAAQQGVKPVTDFDKLRGDFWPEDESADDFTTALYNWRHEDSGRSVR